MSHDPRQNERDEQRDLLRAADPAASLPPADPTRVARLLEETMSEQPTTPLSEESRRDGAHGRSRLTWLVAAAAVVLIAGGVTVAAVTGGDDEAPPTAGDVGTSTAPPTGTTSDPSTATEPSESASAPESVTRLRVDEAAASGRCLPPEANPQVLAEQQVAFDGTVEQVSRGLVTLRPTTFYAGDRTDLVVVQAPDDDMVSLLAGVDFREGERYLVSATGGQVTLCGFSAPWTPRLERLYEEALP